MQISSITFQSIGQTVPEGSLDRMRKGGGRWATTSVVPVAARQFSFRALSIYFTSPLHPRDIYPFAACHNLQHPSRVEVVGQYHWTRPVPHLTRLAVSWPVSSSVCHSLNRNETKRRGEWPVTSSSCACPKDFQSNLSNITTFNQTQKAVQLIFLSSFLDDEEDDETTLQDTHVTTNELTMDTTRRVGQVWQVWSSSTTEG